MNFRTNARLFFFSLMVILCSPAKAQNDWAIKSTNINDNLKDVRFFGNYGVLIGNHGIYYNTTGIDNPGGWKKYIIKTSATDSARLSATKFVQLACTGQSAIFFAVGNDTVANKAVLFRLDLRDSSYTFPFIGNAGSQLNSITAVNYYYSSGYMVAVGNHGLIVSYAMSSNTVTQTVFHAYADLQLIYSRSRYNGHAAIIANDSIAFGTAATNFVADFNQIIGHHVNDAFGDDNNSSVCLLDSQAMYNGNFSINFHSESNLFYKPSNLRFHSISPGVAGSLKYVATDKGIYRIYSNSILEYQPGSQGLPVNKIWFNQYAAFDTGYAVGANGLLLKTVNLGGPVKPYAQLTSAIGGCVNEYYSLTAQTSTTNSCKWYLDGTFLQDYCGTAPYLPTAAGDHELKYIVTNTDGLSDTSIKIIHITVKPQINLPFVVSDTILCKSEPIQVTISNTQNGHQYTLIKASTGTSFGTVPGNGGQAVLSSNYLSDSGYYFIRATNIASGCSADFTNKTYIKVEKTKSRFSADKINVCIGEKFNLFNNCTDAATFEWTLQQDPNTSTSTAANPQAIYYASAGQKTLTLISTSPFGCKDTATTDVVLVYTKPAPPDKCYVVNVRDSEYFYTPTSYPAVGLPTLLHDNGYILAGYGNRALVKSRYGNNRKLANPMSAYLAKYSEDGALKWMHYIDTLGNFTGSETDAQGYIYVIGYCNTRSWYHLNNGDSMQMAMTNGDILPSYSSSTNGFIVKLDSTGRYLWHAVFDDHSVNTSFPVQGGLPNRVIVKNGDIFVTGTFLANLSYVRADSTEKMYSLVNSSYPRDNQNKFLVKLKPDGYLAWKSYGHYNAVNPVEPADIAAGLNGDILLACDYEYAVKFYDNDSTMIVNETAEVGNFRSILIRMNSTGHLVWKVKIEHPIGTGNYDTRFNHIATDNTGSAYVTGELFNFGLLVPLLVTNANSTVSVTDTLSGFAMIKFDANGQYRWSVGAKRPYYGSGKTLVYKNGQLYAAGVVGNNGQALSSFNFTSTNGVNYTGSFFESEFFIVNYDTAGIFKSIGKSGDNNGGHMNPAGLVLDSANNYIITGLGDRYNGGDTNYVVFNQPLQLNEIDVFFAKISPQFCSNCNNYSTWTGIISSAWDNPQNWSCNSVPGSATSVIIPAVSVFSPVIYAGQSFEVWNINLQPGAVMTVQNGATFHVLH
jgi:hypothetical protein